MTIGRPQGLGRSREAVGALRAIVGGPDDDRVLGEPELVELVEDHAREVVHLGEDVGPVPALGLTRVLGIGDRRNVHLRIGQVRVERLARLLRTRHGPSPTR